MFSFTYSSPALIDLSKGFRALWLSYKQVNLTIVSSLSKGFEIENSERDRHMTLKNISSSEMSVFPTRGRERTLDIVLNNSSNSF